MVHTAEQGHIKRQIAAHWGIRAETLDVSDWHVARSGRENGAWQHLFKRHLPLMGRPTARQLTELVTAHGFGSVEVSRMRGVYDARVAYSAEMARPRGQWPYLLQATKLPEGGQTAHLPACAQRGNTDRS